MPVTLRIVKRFNNLSKLNGIEMVDRVPFETREDAFAFVSAVNANSSVDFDVVDWDVTGISADGVVEVLKNPTGGYVGRLT